MSQRKLASTQLAVALSRAAIRRRIPSLLAGKIPNSVMRPSIKFPGVTSNAGFRAGEEEGVVRTRRKVPSSSSPHVQQTSSELRSSIGIWGPPAQAASKVEACKAPCEAAAKHNLRVLQLIDNILR